MTAENTAPAAKPSLATWARITLMILAYLTAGAIFQFVAALIAHIPLMDLNAMNSMGIGKLLILQLFGFLPLIPLVYCFRKFVDKASIASIGFQIQNKSTDMLAGLLMAVFILGGGTLVLYTLGYIGLSRSGTSIQMLLPAFCLFIIVSLNEEILFRGYILNNLLSSMNKYTALLVSAAIFTIFHLLNFNISVLAVVNLMLAGMLLGGAYIFTRNLWFSLSLHLFWNFFQGPVLGYEVSGQKMESVFSIKTTGNAMIHGGGFGFEGSIVCTIMVSITVALVLAFFSKRR